MQENDNANAHEIRFALDKAAGLSSEGKYLHAIQIYQRLIRDFPLEADAPIGLAEIYEQTNSTTSALNTLCEAVKQNPENTRLRLFAGHFYFRQKLWKDVIDVLAPIAPNEEPLAAFFSGYSYFHIGDYEFARHYFTLYLNQKTTLEFAQDAYVFLAKTHIHLGNYDDAMNNLASAEQFYGGHYELHLLYAIIHYYRDMVTHAMVAIEEALRLNRTDNSVLEWAGKIYLKSGNTKKSERFLRECVEKDGKVDPAVYGSLGLSCLYNNKYKEAAHYFEIALKVDPGESNALLGVKKLRTEHKYFPT